MEPELQELLRECKLEEHSKLIQELSLPSVRLLAEPAEGELPLGASRIGGSPDMPSGCSWPCHVDEEGRQAVSPWGKPIPIPFLAQVNFAEVAPFDETGLLPPEGTLLLFIDFEPQVRQILYVPESSQTFERTPWPQDWRGAKRFTTHRVTVRKEVTLPPYADPGTISGEEDCFFDVLDPALETYHLRKEAKKAYNSLRGRVRSGLPASRSGRRRKEFHRMLGWPDYIQNPMKLDAELHSQGLTLDYQLRYDLTDPAHERTIQLKADARVSDWTLLLQIGSVDTPEHDMMWGDAGAFYLWIKRADLDRRDFSQVYFDFQMH